MRTHVRYWSTAVLIAVLSSGSVGVAAYLLDQHDVHIGLTAQVETVRRLPIRCDRRLPFGCEPTVARPGPPPFTLPTFPTFPGEPPPFTLPPFPSPPTEQPPPPPPVAPTTTTTTAPPTTTRRATIPLMTIDVQAPTTPLTDPPTTAPPTSHALVVAAPAKPPRAKAAPSVFGNPMVILTMIVVVAAVGIAGGKAAYDHRKG